MFLLCLSLRVLPSAIAGDASAAEAVRLEEELRALAQRQAWAGVERVYDLLERRGVVLDYEDLVYGAQAARYAGRVEEARDRLVAAAKLRGSREVIDSLAAIDATYGTVQLMGPRRPPALFEAVDPPFDPDQRAALAAARAEVTLTGGFTGLLPRGSYLFGEQRFVVEPGIAVRIEVDPRSRRDETERNTP